MSGGAAFAPGSTLTVETLDRRSHSQEALDDAANRLFMLFSAREPDFATGESYVIEQVTVAPGSAFLADAAGHIEATIARSVAAGTGIDAVVVLTTFGDAIGPGLRRAGFDETRIDMPAGPDHTAAYHRMLRVSGGGKTLYIEAVNEADPKIRPHFALLLHDAAQRLVGGACGSLAWREAAGFCYLATFVVAAGQPGGTGVMLARHLETYLGGRGIGRIDVGTQTAGPFYEKIGYEVVHTIAPGLRHRAGPDGRPIRHDLVMLSRKL